MAEMDESLDGPREPPFVKKLTALLNECCMENGSDTPDYILGEYLMSCLVAFERATRARSSWYGHPKNDHALPGKPSSVDA